MNLANAQGETLLDSYRCELGFFLHVKFLKLVQICPLVHEMY